MLLSELLAFAFAAFTAFLVTPWVKRLAERAGILDKPDRQRKLHRRLVSLWGGLAVFTGLAFGLAAALSASREGQVLLAYRNGWLAGRILVIAAAALLLLGMGLADDKRPWPPKIKLLGQLAAAAAVVLAGVRPSTLFLPGFSAAWPLWSAVSMILAGLWLVAITNAFNFIDGLDGLASGQAVIAGWGFSLLPLVAAVRTSPLMTRHQYGFAALLAAACSGAALGFWRYNRWPARIFLGEAGSSLLGFFLGLSGLLFLDNAPSAWITVSIPVILGWPLLDAGLAILRRLKRGEPISKADHRHLHHRLLDLGFTNSAAAAFIHSLAVLLAAAGLVLAWL